MAVLSMPGSAPAQKRKIADGIFKPTLESLKQFSAPDWFRDQIRHQGALVPRKAFPTGRLVRAQSSRNEGVIREVPVNHANRSRLQLVELSRRGLPKVTKVAREIACRQPPICSRANPH